MSDTELRKQWVAEDGAALTSYLDGYAFDNAYTPTATERLLLDDALHGWAAEQFEVWLNRNRKGNPAMSRVAKWLFAWVIIATPLMMLTERAL
jgi:hypothetical protein